MTSNFVIFSSCNNPLNSLNPLSSPKKQKTNHAGSPYSSDYIMTQFIFTIPFSSALSVNETIETSLIDMTVYKTIPDFWEEN